MPSKRDGLFPSTSIGRAGSPQLQHVPSQEALNAHPLLSPDPPSSSMSNQGPNPDTSTSSAPRYVPYTPRHRPPTSSATTGTTTQSSIPVPSHQHQQGGATSILQLQSLKAAAQGIGLGNGTVGWAILEKLVESDLGPEWDEIWTIITTVKPTLLLPLEPYSRDVISPDFMKDHIAFYNGSSPSPLVTLSGLRGSINNGSLTIQSTLPVTSQPFGDLLKPDCQSAALISLPPLPSLFIPTAPETFPSFSLPGFTSIPLPPRPQPSKPPLPPRPGTSPSSNPSKPISAPRISNPFASLFGRPPPPSPATTSPSPSQISLPSDDTHSAMSGSVEVTAFSVTKKILTETVGKELSKLIKEHTKKGLTGCPSWVIDRVIDFTGPLHPVPGSPPSLRIDIRRTSTNSRSSDSSRQLPSVLSTSTQLLSDPSALSDAFQTFYASIEGDLRAGPVNNLLMGRRKEEKRLNDDVQDGSIAPGQSALNHTIENEQKEHVGNDSEIRIREILEQVESVICCTFYDRAFCPLSGDDASHDDALANRIAALNMLDLGLEHLGVEIPSEGTKQDVHNVVKACGETLQRLEDTDYRSPARKSALLVEAHKQIVDGLSRLPKLRLKPEREFEEQDQKTPKASAFSKEATHEAINEASSSPTEMAPTVSEKSGEVEHLTTDAETLVSSPQQPHPGILPYSDSDTPESTHATGSHDDKLESQPPRSSPPPLPPRPDSPAHVSRSSTPTTVSGDLLFPLLIFSVVKANPAHLVSHLLYTQRFRSRNIGGQESYCLINLMAVVEFLEHVDMGALGLGDSERIMSTAALSPILLAHGPIDSGVTSSSPFSTRLGKRMNQQVEELAGLAGSANKVITGVVDSSFGVLRGFLAPNPELSTPHNEEPDSAPWNTTRPGFGLLRRGSGFSIANVAASLPGGGRPKTPGGGAGEEGQQLIEVSSRPSSIKEVNLENEEDDGDTSTSSVMSEDDSPDRGDTRSVRSFSSMMSRESRDRDRDRADGKERKSLTDRLASMSGRARFTASPIEQSGSKTSPPSSRPTSRPSSWLPPPSTQPDPPSLTTMTPSHPKVRVPLPNRRFLECAEQDIRIGEVGELLREYRRMVQALRSTGAFDDPS